MYGLGKCSPCEAARGLNGVGPGGCIESVPPGGTVVSRGGVGAGLVSPGAAPYVAGALLLGMVGLWSIWMMTTYPAKR